MLAICFHFTFQSGYIQIRTAFQDISVSILYIPIWLYSNKERWNPEDGRGTLHSNLVIFKWWRPLSALHCWYSLHSNLVIFKSISSLDSTSIEVFTFQSGYIQMYAEQFSIVRFFPLHSNLVIFKYNSWLFAPVRFWNFTFQSGYIQMQAFGTCHTVSRSLYIPIWLYSNQCLICNLAEWFLTLHSNLVIFK